MKGSCLMVPMVLPDLSAPIAKVPVKNLKKKNG